MKKINTAIIGFGVVGKRRKFFIEKNINIYLISHLKVISQKKILIILNTTTMCLSKKI